MWSPSNSSHALRRILMLLYLTELVWPCKEEDAYDADLMPPWAADGGVAVSGLAGMGLTRAALLVFGGSVRCLRGSAATAADGVSADTVAQGSCCCLPGCARRISGEFSTAVPPVVDGSAARCRVRCKDRRPVVAHAFACGC